MFKPVDENESGENRLFEKIEEVHYQRGYRLEEMRDLLQRSGMIFVKAVDADTHEAVTNQSERIYVLAREQGK